MNLWIEQVCELHSDGCLFWWSDIVFRLYFPLRCLAVIGILLMLDKKRFILNDVENFPFFISSMACCTGLLSGSIMIGCLDSLKREYSDSMAAATDMASILQHDHFLFVSLSLAE